MSQAPAMPVFTDALLGDTTDLSMEEFGAYCMLLFVTWRNNGIPLADDDVRLARIVRVSVQRWRERLRPSLVRFFDLSAATWRQQRLEKEWIFVAKRSALAREKGLRGGRPKQLNSHDTQKAAALSGLKLDESTHTHTHTEEAKEASSVERRKRGSRLPTDFVLPADWLKDADGLRSNAGLPSADLKIEAVKFVNFFVSQPGAKGIKLNWRRTWVNWALTARGATDGKRPNGATDFTPVPQSRGPSCPPPALPGRGAGRVE